MRFSFRLTMISRWIVSALLALLLPQVPALADTANQDVLELPAAIITVDELVAYALAANPTLAAAEARWLAAREREPQARALPDPHLKLGYFLSEVETRVGPQRAKGGITQRFPWFGERSLAGEIAALGAEAEGARYEGVRLEVVREVKSSFAELWFLDQAREITGEQLALVKDFEQVLRARYRSGAASYAELLKIQVERGKLAERLAEVEDRRLPSAARLNAALGRDARQALPALPARLASGPSVEPEMLRANLAHDNPSLRSLAAETQRAGKAVELAGKGAYPDLTLGLEYMETGPARMDGTDESGKDPLALTLSLNLPIWRSRVNADKREAAARYRSGEQRLHGETLRRAAELEQALFEHREAIRRRDLYRDELLPQARQGYAVGLEAYRSDKLGFQTLVDALRLLYELELTLARSEADRYRHLASIEAIAGLGAVKTTSQGVDHDQP